ncbi:ankyrin repeat domain-containing protein [Thauera butanivorans]|uniref:ankyrin repeat domain-containing protein n=1 Tax=Thauera butanivorans TaxID=86174 RepID=UPI000A5752DF|nr:ankyrin repeat domain-containing protein [Thauera butanivorans]
MPAKSRKPVAAVLRCCLIASPTAALALAAANVLAQPMSQAQAQAYLDANQVYAVAGNLPGAIMNGRVDEVRAMLAVGVDPNGTEAEGLGPVMRFVAMTCQARVAPEHSVALVKALAEAGATMRPPQPDMLPPIVSAAQNCNGEVIRAFVAAGANHSERTTQGYTPLSMALLVGNLDAAKALVDVGATLSKNAAKSLQESAEDPEIKALIKQATR